jgi:hypothetical protein
MTASRTGLIAIDALVFLTAPVASLGRPTAIARLHIGYDRVGGRSLLGQDGIDYRVRTPGGARRRERAIPVSGRDHPAQQSE